MITINTFPFNSFQVNTYLLHDDTGACIIIDAGCQEIAEQQLVTSYIDRHQLKPVAQYCTHGHVDHVLGTPFVEQTYHLPLIGHRDSVSFISQAREHGEMFGLSVGPINPPEQFLVDNDVIAFGHAQLRVLHTPGHANGSLCFYCQEQAFVIVGDVLFRDSIGRTDLPTGNYEMLIRSIQTRLFTLDDNVTVYPGHGPTTTIGYEKKYNPFL